MTSTILVGDCRDQLRSLPERSVQCVVTSPPYFGLRDYGMSGWDGGNPDCPHLMPASNFNNGFNERWGQGAGQRKQENARRASYRAVCDDCGALRVDRQIGLEPTPDEFVHALVEVFREVRRVLRDDGTVWLNLGDSYASSTYNTANTLHTEHGWKQDGERRPNVRPGAGVKSKDLLGIPWMVAFALRADGWYLRSEIVWAKPNPMPESVTDRPTSAHEKLFLLTKQPRYFWDADAIREEMVKGASGSTFTEGKTGVNGLGRVSRAVRVESSGRNKRNVWEIPTAPFTGAHFATFPPKLVEPCVLAGAPIGATVLDPFAGSGTVGVVCEWHNRNFTGIELNPEYAQMAENRIASEGRLGRRAYQPDPPQTEVLFT